MKNFSAPRARAARPALALLGLALFTARPAAAQDVVNNGTTLSLTNGATLYVPGALTNAAGATLTTDGSTLRVDGSLTNAGTLSLGSGQADVRGNLVSTGTMTGGTGTLHLRGTTAQALNLAAGTTLHHLTINNTAVAQPAVTVPASLTVDGVLTLTSGIVRTAAAATISLPDGATVTGEAAGRYVQGNLRITRSTVAGPVDFGHGVVLDGTGQNLGAVIATRTAGLSTAGTSYGTNVGSTTKGIDRVWTIAPAQQPTSAMPVTLSWLADDDNGLTNFTQARMWQGASAAGPWLAVGPAADASATRTITSSATALNTFTVSNAGNPLPVVLLAFTAERRGPDAWLHWETAQELHNDRFEVEVSADGRTFQRIGTVAGQGTTTQRTRYTFADPHLARYAADLLYYRLRQVDHDGTAGFSPVRPVPVGADASAPLTVQAWPNPYGSAGFQLTLRTSEAGPAVLTLHDAVGRALLTRTLDLPSGSSTLFWPEAARLPQGVYLLTVQQPGQRAVTKVVRE